MYIGGEKRQELVGVWSQKSGDACLCLFGFFFLSLALQTLNFLQEAGVQIFVNLQMLCCREPWPSCVGCFRSHCQEKDDVVRIEDGRDASGAEVTVQVDWMAWTEIMVLTQMRGVLRGGVNSDERSGSGNCAC